MKNDGFSLIEMIIVIAIISILLLIAGLSAKTWINKYRIEQQVKEMYADMMNARARAMQKNRMHFVVLSSSGYALYEDTYPSPDGNGERDATQDAQIMTKPNRTPYNINWNNAGDSIEFDSRGLISTNRSIWITSDVGSSIDCLSISSTRILMGAWNGSVCVGQ